MGLTLDIDGPVKCASFALHNGNDGYIWVAIVATKRIIVFMYSMLCLVCSQHSVNRGSSLHPHSLESSLLTPSPLHYILLLQPQFVSFRDLAFQWTCFNITIASFESYLEGLLHQIPIDFKIATLIMVYSNPHSWCIIRQSVQLILH